MLAELQNQGKAAARAQYSRRMCFKTISSVIMQRLVEDERAPEQSSTSQFPTRRTWTKKYPATLLYIKK